MCELYSVPDFLRLWVLLAYTYLTKRRFSRNAPPLKKHSAKAAEYRALMAAPTSGTIPEDAAVRGGDKLILRGLKFHGFHGVKPEERKLGQKFVIDVDAWMDLREAGKSDHLSDTVSYTEIYRIVKEVVEGPPHNLLESVAQQIASTTLKNYPQISAVSVKVAKPHVAVHGPLDYLGVEIFRYRSIDAPK